MVRPLAEYDSAEVFKDIEEMLTWIQEADQETSTPSTPGFYVTFLTHEDYEKIVPVFVGATDDINKRFKSYNDIEFKIYKSTFYSEQIDISHQFITTRNKENATTFFTTPIDTDAIGSFQCQSSSIP